MAAGDHESFTPARLEAHSNRTATISYDRIPPGAETSTTSPLPLPPHRPRNRRSNGNPPRPDIRLVLSHDLVNDPILRVVLIVELHDGPEHHPAAIRQFARIDNLRRPQLRLDLVDPPLDEPLLLTRRVILSVLGQITVA